MFGFNGSEIITFLIFVGIGVLAGKIASGKGRNPWIWGILGFLIPISILFPIFLKPAGTVTGKWRTCKFCASVIPWAARVCPHCQREIGVAMVGE
jgi:hypothetical protein